MGVSYLDNRYRINGLLAAEATAMQNLEKLCNACGCWLTYDIHEGHWAVIINKSEPSKYHFDNSNIIGPITISSTGIYNLYNSVKVSFPRVDIRDQRDFVQITIPQEDRYPNEPDNVLEINYDIVNDPVQAQLLGFIELKQNRVDRIIKFQTDYSKIQVRAGDVIDVTNSVYNFVNKKFRVVTVREVEADTINIEVTALEYDEGVYDENNLNRYARSDQNGIIALGALPAPATPVVTKIEFDTRPRIVANTHITGGVVESVEFWYSLDAALPESSRNYSLLTTKKPTNGTAFPINETIQAEYDGLNAGNIIIKTRSINSGATSVFSTPTATLFAPKQTTDAISSLTSVVDSLGNQITDLPATTIMTNVDGLFSSNANVAQSPTGIYGTFLNVFQANTNVNLATTAGKTNIDTSYSYWTTSQFTTLYNTQTGGTIPYGSSSPFAGSTSYSDGLYALFTVDPQTYKQFQIFIEFPVVTWDVQLKNAAGTTVTKTKSSFAPSIIEVRYTIDGVTFYNVGATIGGPDSQNILLTIPPTAYGYSYVQEGVYIVTCNPQSVQDITHEGSQQFLWPYNFRGAIDQPFLTGRVMTIQGYGWR